MPPHPPPPAGQHLPPSHQTIAHDDDDDDEFAKRLQQVPGIQSDISDPVDQELDMRWQQAHVAGACCLCLGWVCLVNARHRHRKLVTAGWCRGWGWGSAFVGFWLMLAGIIMYGNYPDVNEGLAILVLVLGCLFILAAPHILYNGDQRFREFLQNEVDAMLRYPVGSRVVIVDGGTNPEIGPVAGALGTVLGHIKGKLAVKFDDNQNRFHLRFASLRLPKHDAMGADAIVNVEDVAMLPPQRRGGARGGGTADLSIIGKSFAPEDMV